MCVCVHACACVWACIHVHICVCVHVCLNVGRHVHAYICVSVNMCMCVYACVLCTDHTQIWWEGRKRERLVGRVIEGVKRRETGVSSLTVSHHTAQCLLPQSLTPDMWLWGSKKSEQGTYLTRMKNNHNEKKKSPCNYQLGQPLFGVCMHA